VKLPVSSGSRRTLVQDGRAANPMVVPQKGSTPETIVSQARLSLAEARKTQSDPKTAVGHDLDAADPAVRSMGVSSRQPKKLGQFTTPRLRKLRSCCAPPLSCGIGPKQSLPTTAPTGCASQPVHTRMGPGTRVTSTSSAPRSCGCAPITGLKTSISIA